MENRKNWYLISTKAGCEFKVAQALERMNIVSYIPVCGKTTSAITGKRLGSKTLIPSFVFVFASEQNHLRIRKVDNVVSIMYWLNKPVILRNEEITGIRNFLKEHTNVSVEKLSINNSNKYSFQSSGRNVFELEGETEKLTLASIGYALTATSSVPQLLEVA